MTAFGRGLAPTSIESLLPPRPPRIGIALGGGFARGVAHVGVLKVLEQENIPVDLMAGTSVGALIGALYCGGVSARELEEIARRVRFSDFGRWTISRLGFASNHCMMQFLNRVLQVKTFEQLRIPLAVTATEFATGEPAILRSGPLVDAVRASCAYPGMFLPVSIDGRMYVDGMLAYAVPTQPLRMLGADRVIAVHLKGCWSKTSTPRHVFDVIGQCFAIAQDMNCSAWKAAADVIVEPDVHGFSYDDFAHTADLVAAGEKAMRLALPEVKRWLGVAGTGADKGRSTPLSMAPAAMVPVK